MMDSYLNIQGIMSDAYLFIPCYYKTAIKGVKIPNRKYQDLMDIPDQLEAIYLQEIDKQLNLKIARCYVQEIVFHLESDQSEFLTDVMGSLYISFQENIKTAVVIISFTEVKFDLTALYDQLSCGKLRVFSNEQLMSFEEYLFQQFDLIKCGTNRSFTNLSKKPDLGYLKYLLSNETFRSKTTNNSELISSDVENASIENIAQFSFSEIYAYDTSVVQVVTSFDEDYLNRIYEECLTIFIIEFLQFQEATVSRVNSKVSKELDRQDNFSIKKILDINLEFSRSIKFWNINVFMYPATQKIVQKIANRFELAQNMNVFHENKRVLEHIITTHSVISSERENKILNYIVLFLTLTQVVPIYYNLYLAFFKERTLELNSGHLVMVLIIFALVGIIRIRNVKKLKQLE